MYGVTLNLSWALAAPPPRAVFFSVPLLIIPDVAFAFSLAAEHRIEGFIKFSRPIPPQASFLASSLQRVPKGGGGGILCPNAHHALMDTLAFH